MPDFIVIDDDPINNLICTRIIQIIYAGAQVLTYINPLDALAEMREKYSAEDANEVILFLDINMPELSGWELLETFGDFPESVKKRFKIFILSSSIDFFDKQKAGSNPYITAYIAKPLSRAIIEDILKSNTQ